MTTHTPTYSMRVFFSDEDEGYIAVCPELSNISAFGDTAEEAARELGIAIEGAIDVYVRKGITLPPPSKVHEHSGQLRVRLPKWLHSSLAKEAEADGVSLNTLIVSKLSSTSDGAITALQKQLTGIHEKLDALSPFQETVAHVCEAFMALTPAVQFVPKAAAIRRSWSGVEVRRVKSDREMSNVIRSHA